MAIADLQFTDGFDAYNALAINGGIGDRWNALSAVYNSSNSFQVGRFGGQSYRFAMGNFTTQLHKPFKLGAVNRIAGSCSFKAVSVGGTGRTVFGASASTTVRAGFGVTVAGQIILYNNTSTVIFTTALGTPPITIGNWHTVEWELEGATAKLWVDGALVLDQAALTLNMTGVNEFFMGQRYSAGSTMGTFEIDDLFVQAGPTAGRLGTNGFKIETIRVNGDVTHDFTHSAGASGFGVLDETLVDVSDYNQSGTLNHTDIFSLVDLGGNAVEIPAIQIVAAALRTDASLRSIKLIADSAGTQSLDADWALPTSLSQREYLLTAPPAGGGFSPAIVNALRVGYKVSI